MMTTDSQSKPKSRTITLTGKPPVKIREDDWPVIAHGNYEDYDNEHRFQANRTTDLDIRVRQHADGRAIVYGVYDYSTNFQSERGSVQRAGYVVDAGGDLVEAIQRVGSDLVDRDVDAAIVRDVVNECIAELPAQEL